LVEPFIDVLRNNVPPQSVDNPVSTIATSGAHHGLVQPADAAEPFVLTQSQGGEGRPTTEPLPTIPCGGAHALIAPYYGGGSGLSAKSAEQPLDAITTLARFGLIVPVTHTQGGNGGARTTDHPFRTFTTAKGGELAFITSAFGERAGQMPRTRSIDDPATAICAQGYVPLVDAGDDDDILYRMLQPPELARATSFPDDYAFAGNKTEVTRQIGNAMPIKGTRAVIASMLWDLAA
jgi:DNA (cytosine-5)-methyltransferase 1